MNYWLMKTEPDVFSIDDLKKKGTSLWDGVRNYQARNFMTQSMKVGDTILFYHSNAKPSGVVGLAKVHAPATPDPTQFDKNSEYFDPKATLENPRWFCISVKFEQKFEKIVALEDIKNTKSLKQMILVNRSRLSVQPVLANEFQTICKMGGL